MSHAQITCPHCNGAVSVDTSFTGQTLQCPHCNGQFVAPQVETSPKPAIVATSPKVTGRGKQNRKQTNPLVFVLIAVGVAVVGIPMCCCGLPIMISATRTPEGQPAAITDWRTIDVSNDAAIAAWRLIREQEEWERSGVENVRFTLEGDIDSFTAERLGNQRYRVQGSFQQFVSVGLKGAMGDPNFRSNWEKRNLDATVEQIDKGQWELESFDSVLEVKVK